VRVCQAIVLQNRDFEQATGFVHPTGSMVRVLNLARSLLGVRPRPPRDSRPLRGRRAKAVLRPKPEPKPGCNAMRLVGG
jgi:hypothetical protein